jgi:hypothetical protein
MKEDIIFTAEPQQMHGKYVAEDLNRTWKEVEERPIPRTATNSTPRLRRKNSSSSAAPFWTRILFR